MCFFYIRVTLYTAFKAKSGLYQFTRLPFDVTNGVTCFKREMVKFVFNNNFKAVFPYLYNITICRKDQADHDTNLNLFMKAARKTNLKFNNTKTVSSVTGICH